MSESNLIRYLSQIFKVPSLIKCHKVETAVERLREMDNVYLPEGFDMSCMFVYQRTNVRGNLLNLGPKSELVQMALENGEDTCMVVPDVSLQGADSLYLCAVYVSESEGEMRGSLAALIDSWASHGYPQIILSGYKDKENGGAVHIAAAQLKSLVEVW